MGYYKASTIADLEARLIAAETALAAQATDVDALLTDTNVIPSGTTVTGYAESFESFVVELPGRAHAQLT